MIRESACFFIFLVLVALSEKKQTNLDLLKLKLELEKRAQDLKKQEDTFQKCLKAAEKRFRAREEALQRAQDGFNQSVKKQGISKETPKKPLKMAQKTTTIVNMYPNESSVQIFREQSTEFIWRDPNKLVPNKIKREIQRSLEQPFLEDMSNGLFDTLSSWYSPDQARPFVKELMLPMSLHVDVSRRGGYLETPLMFASAFDNANAVTKLIERGAHVHALSQFGCTALHWAADNGSESACEILLQNGACVNAKNKSGNTPLNGAARQAHVKVVKLLLKYEAETKIKNKYGETPLKKAQPSCAFLIQTHEATLEARISKLFRSKTKKLKMEEKYLRTEKNCKF